MRWHARYSLEVQPAPDESQLLLAALRGLGGPAGAAAAQTLAAVLGHGGRPHWRALEQRSHEAPGAASAASYV